MPPTTISGASTGRLLRLQLGAVVMMLLFSHFAQATSLVPTVLGNSTVGTQVVFIPTAALAEAVDMSEYTAGNRQALEGLGFAVVELELSTATPSEIEQTITQADYHSG